MVVITKLVLDILKPHKPNVLDFATALADVGSGYRVQLLVQEMDEKTETLQLDIAAPNIDFEAIKESIESMGASIHSIDEVEVQNISEPGKSS